MALTKISRSLLDTGVSDSSDATAITIDSSENVGIGQGSPTQKLEVAGNIFVNTSGNPNLTVKTTGAGNNPNVRIQADSNYWDLQTLFSNTNNELDFRYNGTSKMIIDNSGNVGIGTTSPSALLQLNTPESGNHDAIIISRTTHGTVGTLQNSGGNLIVTSNKALTLGSDPTASFTSTSSLIKFEVDGSEKMRINASGLMQMGTTGKTGRINLQPNPTNNHFVEFYSTVDSKVGEINTSTGVQTNYVTSSDYRLKENIVPMEKGLERVNKLKPVKFNWKNDGTISEGFIAHEVQEAGWNEGVIGKKDSEEMQMVDYAKLTPLLAKAIQEQQEQIEELKKEIETLKN